MRIEFTRTFPYKFFLLPTIKISKPIFGEILFGRSISISINWLFFEFAIVKRNFDLTEEEDDDSWELTISRYGYICPYF